MQLTKLTILALAISASACTIAPEAPKTKLTGKLAIFNWLQTANVKQDVKQAINNQDFRLIAIAGRGKAIPGIPLEQARQGKTACGSKYIGGLGDSYNKDKEYKNWWQKAREYAKAYNQKIIEYCLKQLH